MKKMAVHNGTFHADDVFGVALMQSIYNDLEVIRTRDEELLKTCDIVSDVGNVNMIITMLVKKQEKMKYHTVDLGFYGETLVYHI